MWSIRHSGSVIVHQNGLVSLHFHQMLIYRCVVSVNHFVKQFIDFSVFEGGVQSGGSLYPAGCWGTVRIPTDGRVAVW